MKKIVLATSALVLTLHGSHPTSADEAVSTPLDTKLINVSLFKNGLGFVTREGELPPGGMQLRIEDLPAPVHGTFWLHSPSDNVAVKSAVAFEQESTVTTQTISVVEMLEANVGETVELRLSEQQILRGKILAVPPNRSQEPAPAALNRYALMPHPAPFEPATLVLIQTTNGMVALNRNAIQQIASIEGPLKTTIARKKRTAMLRVQMANPGAKGRLVVQYLAKGITWAPSCAIDITDPTQARLTTKAEVINEIEDLDGVSVNFVTGYPNLQFADVTDPISMRGDLASFLNSLLNPLQPGQSRGHRGVVMQQAVLANAAYASEDVFPAFGNLPHEGQTREELFFYEQKGVSLKKGERGYYPLFTIQAPYEHVYEWKIPDTLDEQERYRGDAREPEKAEEIWHSARLTNTGTVPWTTAPAMTMQGGQLLGQDLIYYTSPGGKTTVKITQAVDIKAEQAEYEVERKRNAASFYGYSYDLVDVRGKLKVANFKTKDVTLNITKDLSGEVQKTIPEAKVDQIAKGLKKVNPHCLLCWELPIKARDKIEVEYFYKVYVRN